MPEQSPIRRLLILPLLLLATLVSGCSLLQPKPEDFQPPLMPPADYPFEGQVTQIVSMVDDASSSLLASWSVQDGVLTLVGLTATGQELLCARYDGVDLTETVSPLLPEQVNARVILAQIQMAYWPLDSIRKRLDGSPWQLMTVSDSRRLVYYSRLVFDIEPETIAADEHGDFWHTLLISIPVAHQQIRITTLDMDRK